MTKETLLPNVVSSCQVKTSKKMHIQSALKFLAWSNGDCLYFGGFDHFERLDNRNTNTDKKIERPQFQHVKKCTPSEMTIVLHERYIPPTPYSCRNLKTYSPATTATTTTFHKSSTMATTSTPTATIPPSSFPYAHRFSKSSCLHKLNYSSNDNHRPLPRLLTDYKGTTSSCYGQDVQKLPNEDCHDTKLIWIPLEMESSNARQTWTLDKKSIELALDRYPCIFIESVDDCEQKDPTNLQMKSLDLTNIQTLSEIWRQGQSNHQHEIFKQQQQQQQQQKWNSPKDHVKRRNLNAFELNRQEKLIPRLRLSPGGFHYGEIHCNRRYIIPMRLKNIGKSSLSFRVKDANATLFGSKDVQFPIGLFKVEVLSGGTKLAPGLSALLHVHVLFNQLGDFKGHFVISTEIDQCKVPLQGKVVSM